jgi:hypothetical protein
MGGNNNGEKNSHDATRPGEDDDLEDLLGRIQALFLLLA